MDNIKRDLPERSFKFACEIVKLCQILDEKPGVNRILANQLLRSATSIGANIEEGQGSQSKADFISKYYISCKEARETKYWLRLLIESDIIDKDLITPLIDEASQLIAILTSILKKCKLNQ